MKRNMEKQRHNGESLGLDNQQNGQAPDGEATLEVQNIRDMATLGAVKQAHTTHSKANVAGEVVVREAREGVATKTGQCKDLPEHMSEGVPEESLLPDEGLEASEKDAEDSTLGEEEEPDGGAEDVTTREIVMALTVPSMLENKKSIQAKTPMSNTCKGKEVVDQEVPSEEESSSPEEEEDVLEDGQENSEQEENEVETDDGNDGNTEEKSEEGIEEEFETTHVVQEPSRAAVTKPKVRKVQLKCDKHEPTKHQPERPAMNTRSNTMRKRNGRGNDGIKPGIWYDHKGRRIG